jgi:GNAT superfamily N-acetyltransferase
MLEISLRTATAADGEFAYEVLERTMKGYAVATWGRWLEAEARAETRSDAGAGRSQIIEVNSASAGLLRVDRFPSHFQVEQLFLLAEYQKQGVGSQVLRAVLSEAHGRGVPVRLRVLRINPAKRFYDRHGFRVVSETSERFFMECAP